MAATLNFIADGFTISGGSGLGFFGSAFGNSVKVSEYQGTTYITDSNGTIQNAQVNNIKWYNAGSGYLNSATQPTGTKFFTNALSTLQIRFSNDTAVKTQNGLLYIYDRSATITNPATGVITQVYEIIHPDIVQNNTGSGTTSWTVMSGVVGAPNSISISPSPGQSGVFNNLVSTRPDTIHDWYFALSASPITVGSKSQFGLWTSVEYL